MKYKCVVSFLLHHTFHVDKHEFQFQLYRSATVNDQEKAEEYEEPHYAGLVM